MEYDQDEQNQDDGFFSRLKESPRTVSVLIIILIVAAAIYAFSGNDDAAQDTTADTDVTEEEVMTEEESAEEGSTSEEEAMEEGATEEEAAMEEEVAMPQEVAPEVLAEQSQALPEGQVTEEGYVEVAQSGDGVTHLARRAATRYLNENEAGYALTNEHRIYIEDYIKDQLAGTRVPLGGELTISTQLIQDAVASAGDLSAAQLQNLQKYTYVLN